MFFPSLGDVKVTRFLFLPSVGIALLLLVMIPALLWRLLTRRKVAEPESLVRSAVCGIPLTGNQSGKTGSYTSFLRTVRTA